LYLAKFIAVHHTIPSTKTKKMNKQLIYCILVFAIVCSSCQSKADTNKGEKKTDTMHPRKILLPPELCTEIQSSLPIPDSLVKANPEGCSLECDWFDVCDPKGHCHGELICWHACDHFKIAYKAGRSDSLYARIQAYFTRSGNNMDIKGCSLHCSKFKVCDPTCSWETICWMSCDH
jgi:hypothetical protein